MKFVIWFRRLPDMHGGNPDQCGGGGLQRCGICQCQRIITPFGALGLIQIKAMIAKVAEYETGQHPFATIAVQDHRGNVPP